MKFKLDEKDNMATSFTQTQAFREMTMEQRWRVAQNLYASVREWKTCALRSLHPDWRDTEIGTEVRRSFLHGGSL